EIQPTMYGIFFEDINFAADGGLYAELVKNRSFEFDSPWMGWKHLPESDSRFSIVNELTIVKDARTNQRYVQGEKRDVANDLGLENEGFDGMGVKQGAKYDFSVQSRVNSGEILIRITLTDSTGKNVLASS